jgi:AraC-like DNA-binding protein
VLDAETKKLIHLQPVDGSEAAADVPCNGFEINLTPVERILRRTPLVAAGEYRCPTHHPQFVGGGPEKCPFIVFLHASVRLIPNRGNPEVCTPNTVNLLDVGDSYERLPVSKEGAICDWIAVAPSLLREIAGDVDVEFDHDAQRIFDRAVTPISSRAFISQRMFFNAIGKNPTITQLAVEENAITLVSGVLRDSATFSRKDKKRSARTDSRRLMNRRREIVEEAKCILAREFWDDLGLAQLAERVHCSAGYLSRSFAALSGFTLHAYQQQLRLRAALQMIPEARFKGAGIASHLGFATHSHLSAAFKHHFGITPTEYAHNMTVASIDRATALVSLATTTA